MKKVLSKIIVGVILVILVLLMLCSCANTRYMARHYDRMEAGQVSDSAYAGDGNGMFEID